MVLRRPGVDGRHFTMEVAVDVDGDGPTKEYTLADPETGEVITRFVREHRVSRSGRPPVEKGRTPEFVRVYRTNLRDLVGSGLLTTHELGVLVALSGYLDWSRPVLVDPETGGPCSKRRLANLIGMSWGSFFRVWSTLEEKGLVSYLSGVCVLNANIMYFGRATMSDRDLHDKAFDGACWAPPVRVRYLESKG